MAKGKKIVFFLGAGASLGAGAYAPVEGGGKVSIPTQADFWDTFLRFCSSKRRYSEIESFLFKYFLGYAKVPTRSGPQKRRKQLNGIDVEEVFTFLSERVRAPSTSDQLRTYFKSVWESLVIETGNVFRKFPSNRDTRDTYRTLRRRHIKSFDSVVSFNYDTVFEDSLPASMRWYYEGVEDSRVRHFPILKPHGSINWSIDRQTSLISVEDQPRQSVVVAPTHLKFVGTGDSEEKNAGIGYMDQSGALDRIWSAMEQRMREAKAAVFIGYSFPDSDLYFSSVLRSILQLNRDLSLVLVNPDAVAISHKIRNRFAARDTKNFFDIDQFASYGRTKLLHDLD